MAIVMPAEVRPWDGASEMDVYVAVFVELRIDAQLTARL
jgi:hypothetical protein